jgi:hypothetical protein
MVAEPWSLSINQRCWEEPLSVQDLLTPAPPRRTRHSALVCHGANLVTKWLTPVGKWGGRSHRIRAACGTIGPWG